MTDLDTRARAALARAHASREAPPETAPRLPDLSGPPPVLPRHWGRYDGWLPPIDPERTDVSTEIAGLVPGQRERAGVPV